MVLLKGRDDERIERVALALTGREVRCALRHCEAKLRCHLCPMLERGWPVPGLHRTARTGDNRDTEEVS